MAQYQVIDQQTKQVMGTYQSRSRARNKADQLDMQYGAIRYYVRTIEPEASLKATVTCIKRALRREEGYPVGVSAPLYVACGCGGKVPVPTIAGMPMTYVCGQCATEYDSKGYILEAR
jgi:hypothetical protein